MANFLNSYKRNLKVALLTVKRLLKSIVYYKNISWSTSKRNQFKVMLLLNHKYLKVREEWLLLKLVVRLYTSQQQLALIIKRIQLA